MREGFINLKRIFIVLSVISSFLFANETVKVGYYMFPGYQEGRADEEKKTGYAYEYLQKIASYTGWNYEYVYGERADLINQLDKGEIDLVLGWPKSNNTETTVYSLRPTITATYYLFQSPTAGKLNVLDRESFKKSKIGLLKNSEGEDKVLEYLSENNLECELVYYTDYLEFRDGYFKNEFDAFVSTDLELSDNSYVSIVDAVGNHHLYAAISTRNPKVAELFNNAQEKIREYDPLYLESLHDKYFNSRISNLISNKKDFEFLKKNKNLTIGYMKDYPPFCYEEKDGTLKGLLIDLIKQFGNFVDFKDLDIEYKSYTDFSKMLEDLNNYEIDAIFPYYGDLWNAENYNLQISSNIYSLSMVLIQRKNINYKVNKKIAVSKRSSLQYYYVRDNFSDCELEYFDTFEDCINAVQSGKVDATVSNRFKIINYMNENLTSSFDVIDLSEECGISFAVRRDSIEILDFLNGCLAQVDDDFKNNSIFLNSYNIKKVTLKEFIVQHSMIVNLILVIMILIILLIAHFSVENSRKRSLIMRKQKEQLEKILRQEVINNATIRSVSKMFVSLHYINMKNYSFKEVNVSNKFITDVIGKEGDAVEEFEYMIKDLVTPECTEIMRKFNDLETLKERLGDKVYISQEFCGPHLGWCEASFIVSERTANGDIPNVLYAVRSIEKEKELQVQSTTDELTGCLNRRSFEEDIHVMAEKGLPEDLVVMSLDVNGLKSANDEIGHDAGDELIVGAASCMKKILGFYGKIYRTGGDEFIACLNLTENQYEEVVNNFDFIVNSWRGKLVGNLSISYGAASVRQYPNATITEIVKMSDKRMYEAKENYYSRAGIDRRSSQAAFEAMSTTFSKILRVNLATDEFSILYIDKNDGEITKLKMSEWLKKFADSGELFRDDKEEFLEKTSIPYLREYFKENRTPISIHYKRIVNESYRTHLLEIVPVKNYSELNSIVFLYVKEID